VKYRGEIDELRDAGFEGFLKITYLVEAFVKQPPEVPGAFAVIRETVEIPWFTGAPNRFSQKASKRQCLDPQILQKRWVFGASLVYVGRSEPESRDNSLRKAVRHLCWPATDPNSPLKGPGSLIWYIPNAQELLVAWSTIPTLAEELLLSFQNRHGRLPFANTDAA